MDTHEIYMDLCRFPCISNDIFECLKMSYYISMDVQLVSIYCCLNLRRYPLIANRCLLASLQFHKIVSILDGFILHVHTHLCVYIYIYIYIYIYLNFYAAAIADTAGTAGVAKTPGAAGIGKTAALKLLTTC
jgi:hypothetical protein